MNPVRTLFLGSNWESVETLKTLHLDNRFNVVGVITRMDKPVGRKKILTPTKTKEYAVENGIEVFHTDSKFEKYQEALDRFRPEILVVKAFGEIIPEFFLEAPNYKAINVHFSLLPKYRGAVPIQASILAGDLETGVTIVKMVQDLDAGPILTSYTEKILDTDTNQSLREKLVKKASQVLADDLEKWINGEIEAVPQNEEDVTYCWQKDIAKVSAKIDWEKQDPDYIERSIRAFIPWPVAWTELDNKRVKIFKASLIDNSAHSVMLKPGQFQSLQERLFIGTKDTEKVLQVLELQVEGSTRMSAAEFIRGQDL